MGQSTYIAHDRLRVDRVGPAHGKGFAQTVCRAGVAHDLGVLVRGEHVLPGTLRMLTKYL